MLAHAILIHACLAVALAITAALILEEIRS
jgi:hypothetical protein